MHFEIKIQIIKKINYVTSQLIIQGSLTLDSL